LTGSLNRDIVIFLEIDAGLCFRWIVGNAEELTLDTCVRWAGDVFAIPPLSIS
jgi:hypothetical protein